MHPLRSWNRLVRRAMPRSHLLQKNGVVIEATIAWVTSWIISLSIDLLYGILYKLAPRYGSIWAVMFLAFTVYMYWTFARRWLSNRRYAKRHPDKK